MRNLYENIKKIIVIAPILTPLVFSNHFFDVFIIPKIIYFMIFVLFISLIFKIDGITPFGIIYISGIIYFIVHDYIILGTITPYIYVALAGFVYYAWLVLYIKVYEKVIYKTIIWMSFLLALEGNISYIFDNRVVGLIGNGQFTAMAIMIGFILLLFEKKKNWFDWIMLYTMTYFCIITTSLLIVIIYFVCIILYIFSMLRLEKSIVFLITIGIAIFTYFSIRDPNSYSFRWEIWKSCVRILKDYPAGIGLNRFGDIYNLYRSRKEFFRRGEFTQVENPHSDFLGFLVEGGMPFLIFELIFMYFLVNYAYKGFLTHDYKVVVFFVFLVLSIALNFPLRVIGTLVPGMFVFAYMEYKYNPVLIKIKVKRFIIFFLILMSIYFIYPIFKGNYYFQKGEYADDFYNKWEYYKKGAYFLNDFFYYMKLGVFLRNNMHFEDAIKMFKKALKISPNYPYLYAYIGESYVKLGDYKTAMFYYKKAYKLLPYSKIIKKDLIRLEGINKR